MSDKSITDITLILCFVCVAGATGLIVGMIGGWGRKWMWVSGTAFWGPIFIFTYFLLRFTGGMLGTWH